MGKWMVGAMIVLVGVFVVAIIVLGSRPFSSNQTPDEGYTCTIGPVPEKVQYVGGENSWQIYACWRESSGRSICRAHNKENCP